MVMSLFDRIQNAIKGIRTPDSNELVNVKELGAMQWARESYSGVDRLLMPNSDFDYGNQVAPMLNSAVAACVHWFMRVFPEAPLYIEAMDELGNTEYNYDSDAVRLLKRPNQFYSGSILMMGIITDYLTTGNAYITKIKNPTGNTIELWYTPAKLMQPRAPKDTTTEYVTYYEYKPFGQTIRLEVDDVVHFRYGIDPENVRKGLSPLGSVLREIFTDDEAANYSASLLKNMGVAGLFMTPRESLSGLSREAAETMKRKFKERFTGDRRGEPFVSNMPLDIMKLSFSPSEMNLRDVRRIPEERVASVLGIPAIVAGLGAGLDRATFSNMSEAREMAYESGVIPLQRLIATDLTTQYLPEFQDDGQFAFDNRMVRVLQDDQTDNANRIANLYKSGIITRAEARQQSGLSYEETDEIFLAPTNANEVGRFDRAPQVGGSGGQNAGLLALSSSETAQTKLRGSLQYKELRFGSVVKNSMLERNHKYLMKKEPELTRIQFQEKLEQNLASVENQFAKELSKEFDRQGREIADAYLKHVGEIPNTPDGKQYDNEIKVEVKQDPIEIIGEVGEENLDMLVQTLLATPNLTEPSKQRIELIYTKAYGNIARRTFDAVSDRVGGGVVFNEADAIGQNVLATGGRRAGLVDFTGQAKRATKEAIRIGREEGKNPRQIARDIRSLVPVGRFTKLAENEGVDKAKAYRSLMIAKTETHNAQRQSTIEGYRASGLVELVRAIDGVGGDTDEICLDRDGKIFTLEDSLNETQLEHPNGTLDWEPIVQTPDEPGLPMNI